MMPSIDQKTTDQTSTDVLVVGAGIIGLACAHYLTEQNHAVTVIDQGQIAHACSYGNCGYICPSHIMPLAVPGMISKGMKSMLTPRSPFRIKPQWRPALYTWLLQLAKRCHQNHVAHAGKHLHQLLDLSRQSYDELMAAESMDCGWQTKGLMYAFKSTKAMQDFKQTNDYLGETYGAAAQFLNSSELQAFEPVLIDDLAGAFIYEQDAHLNPSQFANNWAQLLKKRGVQFIENCQLQTINKRSGNIQSLVTSQGELKADQYVIATGAWSSKLAKQLDVKLPVEPGKGYSVTLPHAQSNLQVPVLFPEKSVGLTPFKGALRVGSMMEFVGFNERIPQHRIDLLIDSAEAYLKDPLSTIDAEPWYGWRPMTYDSLPIIDRLPSLDNVVVATGHNMLGLTLAPATGKLVAELISKTTTELDLSAYAVDRF